MKERPILFNGSMVRSILDGRKTQTRRVLKRSTEFKGPYNPAYLEMHRNAPGWKTICPYGQPSDRLWVRETWATGSTLDHYSPTRIGNMAVEAGYDASAPLWYLANNAYRRWSGNDEVDFDGQGKTRVSIHMPRWASRITLEIADVRVQRLQEISEADATAEGVAFTKYLNANARLHFKELWDSINGKTHPWDSNPWLWVLTFKRIEASHVGA